MKDMEMLNEFSSEILVTDHYEDIICLPHHVSKVHPPMGRLNRAAQFSPFAALSGYEEAVEETARLTQEWVEPEESERARLDEKLQILQHYAQTRPALTVTYFEPDSRKEGGAYRTLEGIFKTIDPCARKLILSGETPVPVDRIVGLDSPLFDKIFKEFV